MTHCTCRCLEASCPNGACGETGRPFLSFRQKLLFTLTLATGFLPAHAQQVTAGGTPIGSASSTLCSQAAGNADYACFGQTSADGIAVIAGVPTPTSVLDGNAAAPGAVSIGTTSTAVGVNGVSSVAIGAGSTVNGPSSVAIGDGAAAAGTRGVYLGADAGAGAASTNVDTIGLGSAAGQNSNGYGNVGVGTRATGTTTGNYNVGVGTDASGSTTGSGNSAFGSAAGYVTNGSNNLAAGVASGEYVNGSNNVALGAFSGTGTAAPLHEVNNSVAVGSVATASADSAVAVGAGATASGKSSVALGSNATAAAPNSVALGSGATAEAAVATTGISVHGVSYMTAGANPVGVVSVGSPGAERQLTNVAAGRVSPTSTDAVNGSELYALGQAINGLSLQSSSVLSQSQSYTDGRIQWVQRNGDAGTASAMASAAIPQAFLPGSSMVGAGVSQYGAQTALSVGMSRLSQDGRWILKLDGSANTRGRYGAAMGAGWSW